MDVIVEKKDRVTWVTINRPETMNALSIAALKGLLTAWEDFRDDDGAWVAVLTGAGDKAFCAGADLKEVAGLSREERARMKRPGGIHKGLEIMKPIIAAVNGVAAGGGCELAMACDIRIASTTASLGLTEVNVGAIPGGGGTQRLPRLVPVGIAMEMVMTGRRITAEEALRWGLVNRVVPPEKLRGEAEALAAEICGKGPLAVRAVKEAVLRSLDLPLHEGLRFEGLLAQWIRTTEDAWEGPRAFAEKRKPRFTGK